MTGQPQPSTPFRVLIFGGGVAALEALLALRDLAGDRVATTVVAPGPDFVDRPMTVREPFAYAPAARYDLAALVAEAGGAHIADGLAWVDPVTRVAHTSSGRALPYDALLIAVGANIYKGFPHAATIDDRILDDLLHGLVQDVEGGYVHDVAFVVPERMAWPLPIYELALMTAERAFDAGARLAITLVTSESAPLQVFGTGVSDALSQLLEDAGIAVLTDSHASVPTSRRVEIGRHRDALEVDRVIALPELVGPAVRGLPGGAHGFVPIDPYCRVPGVDRVFAAGDVCDYPLKHGGVASQQADTVAAVIAQLAGADVTPQPLRPEIHGMLLTGRRPRFIRARAAGVHGFESEVSDTREWGPATKVSSRYLAPFLQAHDAATARRPAGTPARSSPSAPAACSRSRSC
jgi:sulfide:quinone oxidoreductase